MRNRIVALCITLFGGFLGLHKFYLGHNTAGIIYLVLCWSPVPYVLAFFDFLGLAFMSDRAFNRQFNGGAEPYKTLEIPKFLIDNSRQESSQEIAATIGELKKLYDRGIITAEEYESKRRKLLDSI